MKTHSVGVVMNCMWKNRTLAKTAEYEGELENK